MVRRLIVIALMLCVAGMALMAENTHMRPTMRGQIEIIGRRHGVKFVYDSSIRLDRPYSGAPLEGLSLTRSLDELLRGTGLRWQKEGHYVMILPLRRFTLSGYVSEAGGETVINATVRDAVSGIGTLSNQHGFYSLTLPEGVHEISFSSFGNSERIEKLNLTSDRTLSVELEPAGVLSEVVVTADLNAPVFTTQTGKVSLTARELRREYSLLSSPDVVKVIQNLSGVASGTEVTSGLYVHGGANDENLFLLDGTPLYQVNHLGGLFSSFNTDVIKNIDFYKSGFPARYGGRLSSVVDVRTKDGDMTAWHGTVSVGLIDGRVQVEGPIVKNRTSVNVGLRRTWLDLISVPAFALRNRNSPDDVSLRYAFHDFNARITHIFSDRSRADISFFSGDDTFKARDSSRRPGFEADDENTRVDLRWGNITAAFNWKYRFSPKLFAVFTAIYTRNRSKQGYMETYNTFDETDGSVATTSHTENHSLSTINDFGARMEFDYSMDRHNHIRAGASYLRHFFRPQSFASNDFSGDASQTDTVARSLSHSLNGHELTVYAEDNISIGERWTLNAGAHVALFNIPGKTYASFEPRLALRYRVSEILTLKASYTRMSQFMHQLSNSYLNLPTDYWIPSTAAVGPSHSLQYAAGVYLMMSGGLRLSAEGFYKSMRKLMEYDGGNSLTPPVDDWESHIRRGRGRAYGMELEAAYSNSRLSASASYTLSWNRRLFPSFHQGWYPDKFDNRHKINLTASYKFSDRIDAYAGWTFHSGNRMTVPQQLAPAPDVPVPGGVPAMPVQPEVWIYEKPNNLTLAPYHRLDLGVNFRKTTSRGHESVWNISIYNAYCRMNPFLAKLEIMPDGSVRGKSTAVFPIIPSFSYTYRF